MKSWKSAESKVGIWYGAKGIKSSGRQPLSGGNSGVTRGDSPHSTIFIETKRDKSYQAPINLYRKYKKELKLDHFLLSMPLVENNKVISKSSNIVCIHNEAFFDIVDQLNNNKDVLTLPWVGNYPRALTLYEQSISIKNSTSMDKNKKVVTVNLVHHGHPGFYIIIDINDIIECSNLILEERKIRESLLNEEKSWDVGAVVVEEIQ